MTATVSLTTVTRQITELLLARHPAPEWSAFGELRGGTGFSNPQSLDVFAVNTYPSKKNRAVVYEVKVSRGDFARELSKPEKREFAESVASECFFAAPAGLVAADEIPEGWGLVEALANGTLRVKKHAKQRTVNVGDWPAIFVLMLLRRSCVQPELPVVCWRYAGRDLTQEELVEIAKEVHGPAVAEDLYEARREAVQRYKEDYDHRRLIEWGEVVREALGNYVDTDGLRAALQGKTALTRGDREALSRAHDVIGSMLGVPA